MTTYLNSKINNKLQILSQNKLIKSHIHINFKPNKAILMNIFTNKLN